MSETQWRGHVIRVRRMFQRIANHYDRMNRLMTFGRDLALRRYAIRRAALPKGGRLLDVGTGTGDMALLALEQDESLRVVGVDFTPAMMRIAKGRPNGHRVAWCEADALMLPFAEATFDAVTSAYLLRNVADVSTALREQVRVVRPGGKVVCLETSPPPRTIWRPLVMFYLHVLIPLLGQVIVGDRAAYTYLPTSTQNFKTPDDLASIMRSMGLVDVCYRRFMLGVMVVHVGTRPMRGRATLNPPHHR